MTVNQYPFYISVKGNKTGAFKGDDNQKGFDGKILGYAFNNSVVVPYDNASGKTTGVRKHNPLMLEVGLGAYAPQFFQACTSNEHVGLEVEFYHTNPANGQLEKNYTVKLTNATIVEATHIVDNTTLEPRLRLHIAYPQIQWDHVKGSTSAEDNWNQLKVG